ncbi:hypothetical protein J6590_097436 [Homalodisca vitripennis]|nr:hypothetical protein J6590_097436 [Homalodisca vitripennis]
MSKRCREFFLNFFTADLFCISSDQRRHTRIQISDDLRFNVPDELAYVTAIYKPANNGALRTKRMESTKLALSLNYSKYLPVRALSLNYSKYLPVRAELLTVSLEE